MKLKQVVTLNAGMALLAGLGFALWGPILMDGYRATSLPEEYMMAHWTMASFARLFGAALFSLGGVLWMARRLAETEARQSVAFSLLLINLFSGGIALIQQIAIWNGSLGWITVGVYALLTLAYGYCLVAPLFHRAQDVRQIFSD